MPRFTPRTDTDPALRTAIHGRVLPRGLLRVVAALALTNVALFVLELSGHAPWSQPVGQLLNPAIAVLAVVLCRRAATDPASHPRAQHVWRLTAWGMSFIAVSITVRLVATLGLDAVAPAGNALQGVGALLLSLSVFRIPLGLRTRAEKAALALDVAAVLVAAAVVVWHLFGAGRAVLTGDEARAVGPVVGAALLAVFLATRASLSGSEVIPPRTLYLRAVSALVGGFGTAASVLLLAARPEIDAQVLLNPIASFTIALSAWFQLSDGADARLRARRRRRYSVLPYVAVVAVDALLVLTSVTRSPDQLVVVVGAVVLTALVVVRQLVAFRENDTLLTSLGLHEQKLRHEATHDALTGLANRALFAERLSAAVDHGGADRRLSLVLVDLDGFKAINDTLGHAVGDGMLAGVAQRLRAGVRSDDVVARLGGDEFAILVDGLGADAVEAVLTRLTASLAQPLLVDGHEVTVRASFGVVEGGAGDDPEALLRQADVAMYEAKERGEGSFERYRPGMEQRGAERHRIAAELRTAIAEDQLVLHYQPVVTLPEGRITGVEALVRWQHPTQGLVRPASFIPAAEETGLVVPLGRWVLREATRQAASWIADHGGAGLRTVAVNASAQQLQDPGFATDVAAALRDSGLDAGRLTIEITESTAVGGGATDASLRDLRAMGVRISLDDFGTGRSTLSLLVDCLVDEIKLDRRFAPVAGADAIAGAVLQLARGLGIDAVAEGVETAEQADDLGDLGYGLAQGFLFARPMTAQALGARLRDADADSAQAEVTARPGDLLAASRS
ncbi:EAL domain-containing protein [Actinotalea ferrariae]|uniref:putative bifunctional diguanylate cyclase/phosphodiesterase n=1 Tax=Actinotalea ferrariae TaxID=1386098 RepID=UPI001C8BC41C|nr:EAL domain-containing protein [Actinotalea ferrariae]MBX9244962.1 EAL domain-containing protein [Actinotalea ferrariae]